MSPEKQPEKPNEQVFEDFQRVLQMEAEGLLSVRDRLQAEAGRGSVLESLRRIAHCLTQGGKIVVTGVGKSGRIGEKIAATFSSTGSPSVFLHPTDALHGDLGIIHAKDLLLALSYTGNTEELLRLLPAVRTLGVPIVALCGKAGSPLSQLADVWIDASVLQEACPHNLAPTTSTTATLAIGDALAVALMKWKGFEASDFARNHPGGTLGRRLHLRVQDLLCGPERTGTVSPAASIDEVVENLTRRPLGAILVTEGKILRGLITDGDLRRSLRMKDRFFQLTASDIMTRAPITITPEQLAVEALHAMENRSSQISVLPVVTPQSSPAAPEWLGLIRLHDLAQSL